MVANALTGANLASGIASTLLPGEGRTVRRSTLILAGAMFDALDGPLARRSGKPTEFGAAADNISDVITCGVAPAVVLARSGAAETRLSRIAPALYIGATAWRVARNGIGPRRSHVFRGLPITGAGILFALGCQVRLPPRALSYWTVSLSLAMFSRIRVLSGEALIRDLETLEIELPDESPSPSCSDT
ncbi:MAG: CDP-alcohol phosphatidyltransferase family protein [Solirubrobacterales bacterium]